MSLISVSINVPTLKFLFLLFSDLGVFMSLVLSLFVRRRLDVINSNLIEQIERMEERMEYLEEIRDDLYG